MAQNMPETEKNRVRTSVILPEDVYEKVANLAKNNDVSVAWVIRQAVVRFLEDKENGKRLKLDKGAKGSKA